MLGLTDRQYDVLRFIASFIAREGWPHTQREIGTHFKIASTNGVNDHLQALERKGYIVRRAMSARSIRLTEYGREAIA